MADQKAAIGAEDVIRHVQQLLNAAVPPELSPELASIENMETLHQAMLAMRTHMSAVSQGDLSQDVNFRGYTAGLLKAHLANLRHLTWQVKQVAQGDFSQRVDFMGEFSEAFNTMVVQLDTTLTNLKATQDALTQLTDSLRYEVKERTSAVNSLRESEARFKYLADHDPLTGAMNRRSFLLVAEKGVKAAFRRGAPCCVALLDIDHFKKFNDTYGHLGGDATLKHVVKLANANLRQSDTMGRFGGEEFIFFFADADISQGLKAADRIRIAIEENPVRLDQGLAPISASLGVSVILPEWQDARSSNFLQKVIGMADDALYQAKQSGRNRVCLAPVVHPDELTREDNPEKQNISPTVPPRKSTGKTQKKVG